MHGNPQHSSPSVAPRPNVPVWLDDTFHPARLGKHRDFVDLRFPYDNVREDHSKGEPEHADKHRDYKPITSNRGLAKSFGFGLNAVWPPFDPGSSRNEFEGELTRHGDLVGQHWQRLNRLVLGSEKEIQDAIIKLSQRDFKDANGKTLDIEHCLNLSWAAARDEYNVHHATEPGKFTSGFRLDPKGGMTPNRSTDLDVFSLLYLTSEPPKNNNSPTQRSSLSDL